MRPLRRRSLSLVALAAFFALAALRAAPAGAQEDPDRRAKAAAHFKQGQAYFQREDFDRALAEYQAAFDLSAEPSLIFNIALCHDRAKRPEQALAAFRRYLELVPDGAVADEAREEISKLVPVVEKIVSDRAAEEKRQREEATRREEAARRDREARAEARARAMRVPRYVVIGGAVVAAAGATVHVLSWRTRGRLQDAPGPDAYYDDRDTFALQRGLAIGLYAAGAATIVTGLVLGLVRRPDEGPQISAALVPGGATVTVGWSR